MASVITDVLAVVMVLTGVVGMVAVAWRAREYDMIHRTEGVVVALGVVLVLAMSFTAIL